MRRFLLTTIYAVLLMWALTDESRASGGTSLVTCYVPIGSESSARYEIVNSSGSVVTGPTTTGVFKIANGDVGILAAFPDNSGDSVVFDTGAATTQSTATPVSVITATVSGTVSANVTQIAGQTANASGSVTFPSTVSSYAGADTSGTTTLLARIPTFPTNFSSLSINGSGYVTYANDPWGVALPGSYGAGTAGYILGNLSGGGAPTVTQIVNGIYGANPASYTTASTFGLLFNQNNWLAFNRMTWNTTSGVLQYYQPDGATQIGPNIQVTRDVYGNVISRK